MKESAATKTVEDCLAFCRSHSLALSDLSLSGLSHSDFPKFSFAGTRCVIILPVRGKGGRAN